MSYTVYLFLLGRILFGGFFFLSGIKHFRNSTAMAGYAASRGVPAPKIAILGTGVLLLLGGAGVVLGLYPHLALLLIAIFLIGVTPVMHAYWKDADPAAEAGNRVNFNKNLALLGAVCIMYLLSVPWPLSWH